MQLIRDQAVLPDITEDSKAWERAVDANNAPVPPSASG